MNVRELPQTNNLVFSKTFSSSEDIMCGLVSVSLTSNRGHLRLLVGNTETSLLMTLSVLTTRRLDEVEAVTDSTLSLI